MTIPDEAVQAASEIICVHDNAQWGDSGSPDMYHDLVGKMLTAALPFLQGVKVDAQGIYDYVQSYEWRGDNGDYTPSDADREMLEDAIVGYLSAIEVAPSPRAQALEEAARNLIANRFDHYKARNGKLYNIEGDDGEKCWIVSFDDMADLESALSSQPVANALPQDVINLVLAAREAWETWQLPEEEFKRLDAALEAFASRVPYENEPDEDVVEVIPSSGCVFADMGVEQPVADGWLPIETAPKDGTQILIEVHPGIFDVVCWSDNAWREGGNFMRLRKEPTRYLPLPASPGASDQSDAEAIAENYLQEIQDGAWGDNPRTRGLARDRLKDLRGASE